MATGQVLAQYHLAKEEPPFDTMWTDIREAVPRCRVRPVSPTAHVVVLQEEGSEPELHILRGDVEIDKYEDDKYQDVKDEVV